VGQTIFVSTETDLLENRVSATPETVKRMVGLGFDVVVEAGAGARSRIPDGQYEAVGARIGSRGTAATADVLLRVRCPTEEEIRALSTAE
jgi:NAD(P) transhydrogenase subunit alpha